MPARNSSRGSAADAVAAALADHPGATAAELAEVAGIGQSTAAKALAALEADGAARRVPGGRSEAGRRQPDRWSPPEHAVPAEAPPDAEPATETTESVSRLRRGELTGLVLEFLAARPGEALGPAAVAKHLGRSAGAVSNALGRLAEAGTVRLVADSPRRYRLPRS
ncbi:MAG TPA: MarR family transcriptional regulator [Acidimicrobiales bacterium]|nr:MarR family transcriptional regulator [Acidimicrobiales bacterium]